MCKRKAILIVISIVFVIGCLLGCINKFNKQNNQVFNTIENKQYKDTLFDTSYVHQIDVTISESDWENLLETPMQKTKYEVSVTIDGTHINHVAFSTKGNSSLTQVAHSDSTRYSFKFNFGKYIEGQTYQGLNKLHLNNSFSDATYMKDYLSYALFRNIGVDAPLVSYVSLSINGVPQGLYVAIEDVSDSFLERNEKSSTTAIYKPETAQLANMGKFKDFKSMILPENPEELKDFNFDSNKNKFNPVEQEGPENPKNNSGADLVYIDDKLSSYSSIFDNTENNVTGHDKLEVIQALKALSTNETIEQYWDIESIIDYFVVHNFVLNFDSYTGTMLHNYYLLEENGILSITPWDYNLAFGGFMMPSKQQTTLDTTALINYPIDSPLLSTSNEARPLWNLIVSNSHYLERYHNKFKTFLENNFDTNDYIEEIDRVSQMIREYVKNDATAFYTVEEFDKAIDTLKEFGTLRAKSIHEQLIGNIPTTKEGQEENNSQLIDASSITLSDMGSQMGKDMPSIKPMQ